VLTQASVAAGDPSTSPEVPAPDLVVPSSRASPLALNCPFARFGCGGVNHSGESHLLLVVGAYDALAAAHASLADTVAALANRVAGVERTSQYAPAATATPAKGKVCDTATGKASAKKPAHIQRAPDSTPPPQNQQKISGRGHRVAPSPAAPPVAATFPPSGAKSGLRPREPNATPQQHSTKKSFPTKESTDSGKTDTTPCASVAVRAFDKVARNAAKELLHLKQSAGGALSFDDILSVAKGASDGVSASARDVPKKPRVIPPRLPTSAGGSDVPSHSARCGRLSA